MPMRRRTRRPWIAPIVAGLALTAGVATAQTTPPDLLGYVNRPDPSFSWTQGGNHDTPEGKIHQIRLTSQTWQGIPWVHQMRVYEPNDVKYPTTVLLFITGGST